MKITPLPEGPYDHSQTETGILNYWLSQQLYKPETARKKFIELNQQADNHGFAKSSGGEAVARVDKEEASGDLPMARNYTIINPPPNAYARPHLGNVSGYAYQDVFGRRARQTGLPTLLLPGKDHAAQQAEIVYIRDILSPQGKSKEDFSREEFYQEAYNYFTGIMEIAQKDEKRIGLSADYNRDIFTLDPRVASTVYRTFGNMWKDGLVYKGVRIVNWSPGLQSAVADIDTERETIDSTFYYIKYALPQVDQDVLNLRATFKNRSFKFQPTEIVEIEQTKELKQYNQQGKILLVKGEIDLSSLADITDNEASVDVAEQIADTDMDAELVMWISGWTTEEMTSLIAVGDKLELQSVALEIPLSSSAQLVCVPADLELTTNPKFVAETDSTADTVKQTNSYPNQLSKGVYTYIFKAANVLHGSAFIHEFALDDEFVEDDYARGLIVATVRPETKFGDTALACNPKDQRYAEFVGKDLELIGANGPVKIKMITDPGIDMEFGTGLLKVTPAHAPTDYKIYLDWNEANPDNKIGYKNIIGKDSKLNHIAGKDFAGMHAEEQRDEIAALMRQKGVIVFAEPTESNITVCERTKTVIQPIMSSQWFIDTDELKKPALAALQQGELNIHPDYMGKKLAAWLENLRDWPISRSIWWGYRLPVWYKGEVEETTDANGQIVVKIADVEVEDMQDAIAKDLMRLDFGAGFAPLLVPGKHCYAGPTQFAAIKREFPWSWILPVSNIDKPSYVDYKAGLDRVDWSQHEVVVTHSLGASAMLEYIVEHNIKLQELILVAPALQTSNYIDTYRQRGFFQKFDQNKDNFADSCEQLHKLVAKVTIIHSDNDDGRDYEDSSVANYLAQLVGDNGEVICEPSKAHFFSQDYTNFSLELAERLRALAGNAESSENPKTATPTKYQDNNSYRSILVPGHYAPEVHDYYADLKAQFANVEIVDTGQKPQTRQDYFAQFEQLDWDQTDLVVAHSLGAAAILDYLLETNTKIGKLILLAPSNEASESYVEFKTRGFWEHESRLTEIHRLVGELKIVVSDNDDFYELKAFESFADKLEATDKLIVEPGKMHYNTHKYKYPSEILEAELLAQWGLSRTAGSSKVSTNANNSHLAVEGWIQDEDVFDTWFSSGQWPVATLQAEGLMHHYPTSTMETAFDILELWVSRMLMLGLYITGEVPFKDVYLHGLIKAADGQKMSKSKGNIVNIDDIISEYGADTLRMFYVVGKKAGASYRIDPREIKGYRNFLNKLWNGSRLILSNIRQQGQLADDLQEIHEQDIVEAFARLRVDYADASAAELSEVIDLSELSKAGKDKVAKELDKLSAEHSAKTATKIDTGRDTTETSEKTTIPDYTDLTMLKSIALLKEEIAEHFDKFRPGMAAEDIVQHFWHTFADIYLEAVKPKLYLQDRQGDPINRSRAELETRAMTVAVLLSVLSDYLKLLHPFVPFITEELWQHLPTEIRETDSIVYAQV